MQRKLIIFVIATLCSIFSYAQNTAIKMEITEAVYENRKLGFRIIVYNNSKDTLRLVNAGAKRFARNTRVITPDEMGLKEMPYRMSLSGYIPCGESIGVASVEAPEKVRKSIPPEAFLKIAPGGEHRLEYCEFKPEDFCTLPTTKQIKLKVTYKLIAKPNYFTPGQMKEIDSLLEECTAVESELPVWNLSTTKKMLIFYKNYQQLLDELYKGTITSNEVVLTVK